MKTQPPAAPLPRGLKSCEHEYEYLETTVDIYVFYCRKCLKIKGRKRFSEHLKETFGEKVHLGQFVEVE